jgi:predicted PurR-regulated permease PerM
LTPVTTPFRQMLPWLIVAAILAWVAYQLRSIIAPFVAAAILAYAFAPAVDALHRLSIPRVVGALVVMLVSVLSIIGVVLVLAPIIQSELTQIRTQLPGLALSVSERVLPLINQYLGTDIAVDGPRLRQWLTSMVSESSQDLTTLAMSYLRSGGSLAMEIIGIVVLVPVLLVYLLLDWHMLTSRAFSLIPLRWASGAREALSEIDALLGQYLRGQLLVMASLAVFYSVGLWIAGVGQWLPLGVLTGLLAFIPYIGVGAGLLISLISAMLQLGLLQGVIAIAVVFGLGQIIESYWLTPRLVGERIGLHPIAVLFALLAFGTLFGFVGLLLALPLAAAASVLLRRLLQAWLASDFHRSA